MKLPKQPSVDKDGVPDFRDMDMYRIPIRCEENVRDRAPYVISQRLNRPRRSRSHSEKVAVKLLHRIFGCRKSEE